LRDEGGCTRQSHGQGHRSGRSQYPTNH
jgi:hypothetical protein